MIAHLLSLMVLAAGPFPDARSSPSLDGRLDEWGTLDPVIELGGESTRGDPFALQRLEGVGEGSRLWLAMDFRRTLGLLAGPAWEGPLCVEVQLPDRRRLSIDLRNRRIDLPVGPNTQPPRWTDIDLITAPTVASSEFELRVDLATMLHAQAPVWVSVHADRPLSVPLRVAMGPALPAPTVRSTEREKGTCVRVANLNTHLDGLSDPQSREPLSRLLSAVAADVYTFQEQWKTPAAVTAAQLGQIQPGGQATWNVHKVDGCIIATHGTLEPVRTGNDRYAAAIITVGHEPPMLVLSVHPKCCGFMGSDEDLQRIEQSLLIARTIREVQAEHPGIPVLMIGDCNMVGSDYPLRVVREAVDPELVRWPLKHLASTDEYTFFDPPGSFPPSTLDLVVHSPNLKRRNGFVLDSTTLPAETLAALSLERSDSRASDHMLIVADFTLPD